MKRKQHANKSAADAILFAVTGMSPAVLTETVWALAHDPERPILPSRVVVVTTSVGRKTLVDTLLRPSHDFGGKTVWESLRESLIKEGFDLTGRLQFGETGQDIRVFVNGDQNGISRELADIATPEDNAAAADFLLEQLRSFVVDPDLPVIASIAGGRKTMGALLFACMTLVGRETDRITHVLVDPRYEQPLTPMFFFPGQPQETLRSRDGRKFAAHNASINLSDIPFVPLRNRFQELEGVPGTYRRMVAAYSSRLKCVTDDPVVVHLDGEQLVVTVNGKMVPLRERSFFMLEFLLKINTERKVPVGQIEGESVLKEFLTHHPAERARKWAGTLSVDDMKRELNVLRTLFTKTGLCWMPGLRRESLRLPPFRLTKKGRHERDSGRQSK